jgi:UPF0042 nucleotide-binding protein
MTSSPATHELLVVTGMSGAGRSTAANALEDLGWFVVDNLPPQLLPPLVELASRAGDAVPRIAAIVDVRGGRLFADAQAAIASLRESQLPIRVVFLDASDATLVRRFEQVRRPHPLQGDGTLVDGIEAERERMTGIRGDADLIIDTSDLNIHQLSTLVNERFAAADTPTLRLTVQSFGFKYGAPTDVDALVDARFLPNPFWNPELKALTGLDEPVSTAVLGSEGALAFLEAYTAAQTIVLEGYGRENKRSATIAVGCTGGKHRSVAIAAELARRFAAIPGVVVSVRHRDLGRE